MVGISEYGAEWAKNNGYNFKDGRTTQVATFTADNESNVVQFELIYQPYSISYNLDGGSYGDKHPDTYTCRTVPEQRHYRDLRPHEARIRVRGWGIQTGTQAKIDEVSAKIKDGSFKVFEGEIKDNQGNIVNKAGDVIPDGDITGKMNWYFETVVVK